MAEGKVPERKPDGWDGPRDGYPKDQKLYADPENWKYPVHTPFHTRAARRYFDQPENRTKYTLEEQAYIDWRIGQALRRYGVVEGRSFEDRVNPFDKDLEEMTLRDLLVFFLGEDRLKRALAIGEVTVDRDDGVLKGDVKGYPIRVDVPDKRIAHACPDWERRSGGGLFCKHVGAVFLKLSEDEAVQILRQLIPDREKWIFQLGEPQ